jgi:DNA-binding IclR family transcriptional regulator
MSPNAPTQSERHPTASPPTARVIDILNFLVRHQGEELGLSELARRTGISKPTCLAILTELAASGYLRVDPRTKTYRLGPALVTAGHAAQRDFALDPIVAERLRSLARRFGVMCLAAGQVGDEFMTLEVAAPDGVEPTVRAGQVSPFALPTALMYLLWRSDEALEEWVHSEHRLAVRADLDELRQMAAELRSTGYLVENLTPTLDRVYRILAHTDPQQLTPEIHELIAELLATTSHLVLRRSEIEASEAETHRVGVIAAPTFDAAGEQSLLLVLVLRADLSAAEIAERGSALRADADLLTDRLGGHAPRPGRS